MPRIGVGIVGLSARPDAWATMGHLPRLLDSSNFSIVALCNSSLQSTRSAIETHKLPESVRAHASYAELAADPGVDLVVVSTRADTHFAIAEPAMRAGKDVFVEWPLASSTAQARQMAALATQYQVKTIIGFQARASPAILKLKEMVDGGALGSIHSVNYQGVVNVWQNNVADERYLHFIDRTVGGNLLTIYGGHTLDAILYTFGELKPGSYTPMAVNIRRQMRVRRSNGVLAEETLEKDTPDQILLQGQLDRDPPAVLSFHLRAGGRSLGPSEPGSTWKIYGSRGELVIEFASAGPQMAKPSSMRFSNLETNMIQDIVVDEGGNEWMGYPAQGRNVGRLYEAYAAGIIYGDFALALRRHELLDEFWATMK